METRGMEIIKNSVEPVDLRRIDFNLKSTTTKESAAAAGK